MSWMDFNTAEKKQSFELIPNNTVVSVVMSIRPGGMGDGGWFRASQSSDAMMLDCEFVVTDGPFARRKIWQFIVLDGGKRNDKGESIGGNMGKAMLRAIIESAKGIRPDDDSPQAIEARRVNSVGDFNGMQFRAKIGVSKDKTGQYEDKNQIKDIVTPDMKEYTASDSAATMAASWAGSPAAAAPSFTPPPASNGGNPAPEWAR